LFDRAGAGSAGVAKIDCVNIFDTFAPNRAGLDLQTEGDSAE